MAKLVGGAVLGLRLCFLGLPISPAAAGADSLVRADSLLPAGDFEGDVDWGLKEGARLEREADNRFLRLEVVEPGKTVMVYRLVSLAADAAALELSYRVRYRGVVPGKQKWFDGRIMMNWKNEAGESVRPSPSAPSFKGTSKSGWESRSQKFLVPDGATRLEIMFTLFNATAGRLDFDDILLRRTDPAPVKAALEEAAQRRAAEIARRAAAVKPQVPVPSADRLPPELRVVGNQIQTADGKSVWLQGVSLASLEWSAAGENILQSTEHAISVWKANVIRQPVRDTFWFGKGDYQNDGGAGYRQLIDDSINLAAAHGAYVVIDLHRFRAPTADHVAFWREVATKYRNHPAVLFELLNEPHDISWEVWRDGGPVTDQAKAAAAAGQGTALAENDAKLVAFHSVGMQAVVNAVRETGARNIVIVGGLDWGYDLSGIVAGYALDDRGGNGIVYSTHVYPWKSDWQGKFLALVEKYPLFVGELGGEPEPMSFIPPERHEDPHTWAPDMLGVIQKHKLHWTGWCFHTKSSPRLLADWDYTPTEFWGRYVKDALAGRQFEVRRMR